MQPAAHLGQAVMFQEPDRLTEDGPAHAVPLHELGLGPQEDARLQATGRDAEEHLPSNALRELLAFRRAERDAARERLPRRPAPPE